MNGRSLMMPSSLALLFEEALPAARRDALTERDCWGMRFLRRDPPQFRPVSDAVDVVGRLGQRDVLARRLAELLARHTGSPSRSATPSRAGRACMIALIPLKRSNDAEAAKPQPPDYR